jgi:hypothetical protein
LVPEPLYAAQEDLYFGVRNGQNMSGPGTAKKCEGELHVCFKTGHLDDVLGGASTEARCLSACLFSECGIPEAPDCTPGGNMACSYDDCVSRCVAARVDYLDADCT